METLTLLPCIDGIRIESITTAANRIVLHLMAGAPSACCPMCSHLSQRVHSHYRRTLADLPWNRVAVCIHLKAQKFYCDNADCIRHIFTEPLPELAARYARKTHRLQSALSLIGYALGGQAGAKVAVGLGLSVSPDTLLRRVRAADRSSIPPAKVRVLGVDDFAFRKGQRYGTILVDLERRRLLDLLPDRSAETLTNWLKAHPEIEVVSRDRGGNYAQGAKEGAPHAVQVADRFHLLKNVTEVLERLLIRHHRQLRETARHLRASAHCVGSVEATVSSEEQMTAPTLTRSQQDSSHRRDRRMARYEQALELQRQGLSLREIARKQGLSRNTVKKWLSTGCFREYAKRPARLSKLTPYHSYLKRRWEEGCHSAVQLFREIQSQGYSGSINLVQRCLQPWRDNLRGRPRPHRDAPPSARCVLWWLLGYYTKADAELKSKQMAFVTELIHLCPEIQVAQELAVRFQQMVKHRHRAELDIWLKDAAESSVHEMQTFAQGLRQDYDAVAVALSSEYSNGQVEGQVNRLKMLKRQMYGRAKLDLLRARVLPMAQAA